MGTYIVKVVREEGKNEVGEGSLPHAEEELVIKANSKQEALNLSYRHSKLSFFGQVRRTFINGEEYFNKSL